jgi:hypothetical protein
MTGGIVGVMPYKSGEYHKNECYDDQCMDLYLERNDSHISEDKPHKKKQRKKYDHKSIGKAGTIVLIVELQHRYILIVNLREYTKTL